MEKQFLFIIGAPKSGTTWLQIMLGAHPQVCTTVELTIFNRYTAPWIRAWENEAANIKEGRWHQGLPFLWTEKEFYEYLKKFVHGVYERVIEKNPNATHILDKQPNYSAHIEEIDRLVPDAKYIHLVRDGRDVAVSMVAAQKNIGYGSGTIPESAQNWLHHVRMARQAAKFSNRYLEVRYEDLLTDGAATLKTIFDFCGLPASSAEVATIIENHQFSKMKSKRQHADRHVQTSSHFYRKGVSGSWQEELAPLQRYAIDRIAGGLIRELGYAHDGWWHQNFLQKFTLPFLDGARGLFEKIRRTAARVLGNGV